MIIEMDGTVGSGKTLLLAIIASITKRKIVSNFHLNYIKYEQLDMNKFLQQKYEDCLIFLDEGYVYFESRISMSKQNRLGSYVLFQSRKRKVDIYLTFQLLRSIDIREREMIDISIKCQNFGTYFQYDFYNLRKNIFLSKILTFEKAKKFFKYYNTYEIITNDKMMFDIQSHDEKLQRIKEYAENIIENNDKITHNTVKLFCYKHEIDKSFESIIYAQIKELQKS